MKRGAGSPQQEAFYQGLYWQAVVAPEARFHPTLSWERMERARHELATKSNAAGVDGVRMKQVIRDEAWAHGVHVQLLEGSYRPDALRRVSIPKDEDQYRDLGIATVKDRLVQYAMKSVLEPVLEADFAPNSACGRPGMDRHGTIDRVQQATSKYRHLRVVDIKGCFDNTLHTAVWAGLRRFTGPEFWVPMNLMLMSWQTSLGRGLPQGLPLSPLLMNAALNDLDWQFYDTLGVFYVRYMDDIFIAAEDEATADTAVETLKSFLQPLGLELNMAPHKYQRALAEEGVTYLGVHVWRDQKGEVQAQADPVRLSASENRIYEHKPLDERLAALRGTMQAWGPYMTGQRARRILAAFQLRAGKRVRLQDLPSPGIPESPRWMQSALGHPGFLFRGALPHTPGGRRGSEVPRHPLLGPSHYAPASPGQVSSTGSTNQEQVVQERPRWVAVRSALGLRLQQVQQQIHRRLGDRARLRQEASRLNNSIGNYNAAIRRADEAIGWLEAMRSVQARPWA